MAGSILCAEEKTETLEGTWSPKRLVVLEFENAERAKAWVNSSEYAPARALRNQHAKSQAIVVDGV